MNVLKLGSRGNDVMFLQQSLNLMADGYFGRLTDEAVKSFQKENGLTADGIVGPKTWAKLGVKPNEYRKSKRRIREIIVHCSATPEGRDYTVADIRRWHLARGFSDIGYHYVIYRDGSVHPGRNIDIAGAHCTNHNAKSIGVCYIGGVSAKDGSPEDTRTEAQKGALVTLLKKLKQLYPQAVIHSHRDFANKACPSFDATKEYVGI